MDLARSEVPDAKGNVIPSTVTSGSALLASTQGEMASISVATSAAVYNVRNATCSPVCGTCNGAVSVSPQPTPVGLIPSGTMQLQPQIRMNTGGTEYLAGGAWSSSNTTISTVNSTGLAQGKAAGSSNTYLDFASIYTGAGYICEGGTFACPTGGFHGSAPTDVFQLTCTGVTRGQSTTCSVVSPAGTTFSGWKFTDPNGNSVTTSSTTSSWSGTVAKSGTASVVVSNGGASITLTASLVVNARTTYAFSAKTATKQANGYMCKGNLVLQVPTTPSPGARLGESCDVTQATANFVAIGSGPNTGYTYVTGVTDNGEYSWIVAPDVENPASTFYRAQCGTYNATSKPNGFISGSNLLTDDQRHEGGVVNSHYANYKAAIQIPSDNAGTQLEALVSYNATAQSFSTLISSTINSAGSALNTATSVEPCGNSSVTYNASCMFDGYVNYSPYAACN